MEILKSVLEECNITHITITSALGTKTSPHDKNCEHSHYDANNPKLDFGGGLTKEQAENLSEALMSTGKFEFATPESDGTTWHLDVKIRDSAYADLDQSNICVPKIIR